VLITKSLAVLPTVLYWNKILDSASLIGRVMDIHPEKIPGLFPEESTPVPETANVRIYPLLLPSLELNNTKSPILYCFVTSYISIFLTGIHSAAVLTENVLIEPSFIYPYVPLG
jgi:hypothetical protein